MTRRIRFWMLWCIVGLATVSVDGLGCCSIGGDTEEPVAMAK